MNRREALTAGAGAVLSIPALANYAPADDLTRVTLTNKTSEPLSLDLYGLMVYKGKRWCCEFRYKLPGRRITTMFIERDEPTFITTLEHKWELKVEASEEFEWKPPFFVGLAESE